MRPMRALAAVAALATLATACTTVTDGTAAPAPTLGHAPKPITVSTLAEVLLDAAAINDIMGTTGLKKVGSGTGLLAHRIADMDCLAAWGAVEQNVYDGTGWLGVQRQQFRENLEEWDHIAYQAVVAFPDGLAAHDTYAAQVGTWGECNNRTFNDRPVGDPEAQGTTWSVNTATEEDGVLTLVRSQERGAGWACQRALNVANNVVIDVETCAGDISNQAVRLAKQIAEKISAEQ